MNAQNILYLNKSAEIGGSEVSLFLLLKHLDQTAYAPIVVLPSVGPFVEQLQSIGIKVITTPVHTIHWRGGNPFPYLGTVWRLARLIRQENIRLVHSNNHVTNQYGVVAAKLCRVPIICHMRDMNSSISIRHAFLPWADHLIANSQAVARSYLEHHNTPEKVTVIYNGVDLAEHVFQKEPVFRAQMGISAETLLLGIVGRILADKGHHVLVQALVHVYRAGVDFRLAIIGPTEPSSGDPYQADQAYLTDLRLMITKLELKERIIFCGPQPDMPAVYRALDILLLPTFQEGFGRTLVEAMAAERSVVASAVGGTPEVVEPNVTGLLVPPGDPRSLAEAILTLARDREMARRMGLEGRKRVERLFTIQQNVAQTEVLYRQVLHQRGMAV